MSTIVKLTAGALRARRAARLVADVERRELGTTSAPTEATEITEPEALLEILEGFDNCDG